MKYRLRVDSEISGYMEIKNNVHFYSKDMYGWTNQPIEYNQKDRCLNLKDKKGTILFHGDLCVDINTDEIVFICYHNEQWYYVNHLTKEKNILEQSLNFSKRLKKFDEIHKYPNKFNDLFNS